MDLYDALSKEIGNIKGEDLLFHALACILVYNLEKKKKKESYEFEDAFRESTMMNEPVEHPVRMIPRPS